jgi:DNA invertase Pin-like site-specific DNA recombinase
MLEKNPQNRRLGYARASTYEQTFAAQLEQLRVAACTQIYRENATGARPDQGEQLALPELWSDSGWHIGNGF